MSNYSFFASMVKHFHRLSVLDRLGLVIALWSKASDDDLNAAQRSFLTKVETNAKGYQTREECDGDFEDLRKHDF